MFIAEVYGDENLDSMSSELLLFKDKIKMIAYVQ